MKFGSGDLRFDTARTDEKSIRALPAAVASYFKARQTKRIYIGFDTRLTSPGLASSICSCMEEAGIDVVTSELPHSSCLFYWSCLTLGIPGIMVTASHNPGSWNGLKMVESDLFPIPSSVIERYMGFLLPHSEERGTEETIDLISSYRDSALELSGLDGKTEIRILVDFLHGVNAREVESALSLLPGIRADFMHPEPDGSFPAGDPNPMIESSVAPFREKLRTGAYDLGFCFDGDGDRTALYTSQGTRIESFSILPLIAGYLSDTPGMLSDAKLPLFLMKDGMGISRTGHSWFKRMMRKESRWTIGAEGSGHFFYRMEKDGRPVIAESSLLTMLLIIRAYVEGKDRFHAMQEEASRLTTLPEISKEFMDPEKTMAEAKEHFIKLGAEMLDRDSDGGPLMSLIISMPDYQIYQHASETEHGKVRWQITEWSKNAGKPAFEYLNHLT